MKFFSSRNSAAPIAGPSTVPLPPRIIMIMTSPERCQCRMSVET